MRVVYAERIPKSHLQAHLDRMQSLKDGFEEALFCQDDVDEDLADDFGLIECGMLEVQAYLDSSCHDRLRSAYEQNLAGTSGFLERRSPDSEMSRSRDGLLV